MPSNFGRKTELFRPFSGSPKRIYTQFLEVTGKREIAMPPVSTCLISQNVFLSEGIKSILSKTEFDIHAAYSSVADARQRETGKNKISLVIVCHENNADSVELAVKSAKSLFPESRIAVLTAQTESNGVMAALAAGADGCLLRNISPDALIGSLSMIMAGEKICPTPMLNRLIKQAPGNENSKPDSGGSDLSSREMQVLSHLASGKTNKQIARNLDITEATVKVHIKTVLRKLDLSNRTQAAVWAVNKGFAAQVVMPPRQAAGNM
jgi:two-component system nitrate/nitrite response regulator NarL